MAGKPSSPKIPTLGLVILECRQTTNVAQAMHKELRVAWGIAVEGLSGFRNLGGLVFSLRPEAEHNCMYKPVQQKVSFLSPSVERDCLAHSCSLSGQPFRSSFNVPGDSVHAVDSTQISSWNLFLKRLPLPSLYRPQRLVSTYFNLKLRIPKISSLKAQMDNKPSQFLLPSQLPAKLHCVYGGLQLFQFNYTSHRGSAQPPSFKITSFAIPMLSTCRDSRGVALSTYRTGHRIMSQNRQYGMGMFSCHFPFLSLDLSCCCFSLSYG
jgi:hypothetical protein